MIFTEAPLSGAYVIEPEKRSDERGFAYVIEPEKHSDERGFFARVFCEKEFSEQDLASRFVQANNSLARTKGTLRGMHYQLRPATEVKLVRCMKSSWSGVFTARFTTSSSICGTDHRHSDSTSESS
jgi:dTDP-4-dehydrorhamnose 3,5-epimerase-like enzyme